MTVGVAAAGLALIVEKVAVGEIFHNFEGSGYLSCSKPGQGLAVAVRPELEIRCARIQ
jgi:hypothetical protein